MVSTTGNDAPFVTLVGTLNAADRSALASVTVSANDAVGLTPGVEALIVTGPVLAPAVTAGDVARPEASVLTCTVLAPPGNDADPVVTLNGTGAPTSGVAVVLVTVATSGAANTEPAGAVWPPPEVAVIAAGTGARTV